MNGHGARSKHLGLVAAVVLIALVLLVDVPGTAAPITQADAPRATDEAAVDERTGVAGLDLSAYRGLGTWIDMFNERPWDHPGAATEKMALKGVSTVYIETSNYKKWNDLYRPTQLGKFIDAAHAQGLKIVAWYLPSFDNFRKDFRRSRAAIDFRSSTGQTFDGFALDIEATVEPDIAQRNRKMLRLSRAIREYVGATYTLGAIVPDATSRYWPSFPYAQVDQTFDVFLPMAYFTYTTHGTTAVRRYVRYNVAAIRTGTRDADVPIHAIGGIAGETHRGDTKGFTQAVRNNGLLGGSLYDFPITTRREWRQLAPLASP